MTNNTLLVPPRSAFRSREELCAFVSYKMRRATELFTFKCSLYQRELKLYLPEPVPKHRRWIDTFDSDSIVTIPISKIEKEEIELFRKHYPDDMDLDNIFPGDLLQRSFKKRISTLLTSLVNKIVFLLVLRHDTWYVHQEARDGLREYLLNKIWPKQPKMRLLYRDHVTTFVDTRIRHFRDSVGRYFRDLQANSKNGEFVSNMIVTCDYKQSDLDDMITKALNEQKLLLEKENNLEYIDSPKSSIHIQKKEIQNSNDQNHAELDIKDEENNNNENENSNTEDNQIDCTKTISDEEDKVELEKSTSNKYIQKFESHSDSEIKDEYIEDIIEPPLKKTNFENNIFNISTSSISSNVTTLSVTNSNNHPPKDELNNSPINTSIYSPSLFTPLPNSIFSVNDNNRNYSSTSSCMDPNFNLNNFSNIVYRNVHNSSSSSNISPETSFPNINNQGNFPFPMINSTVFPFATYPNLTFNHPNYFNKENLSLLSNNTLLNLIHPNYQLPSYYIIPNYTCVFPSTNSNHNCTNPFVSNWFNSSSIDPTQFYNPFINKMNEQTENFKNSFNTKSTFDSHQEQK